MTDPKLIAEARELASESQTPPDAWARIRQLEEALIRERIDHAERYSSAMRQCSEYDLKAEVATHHAERLAAALDWFASQRTVDEILHNPEPSEFAGATPERRIELIGERKRAHDEAILTARTTLNDYRGRKA